MKQCISSFVRYSKKNPNLMFFLIELTIPWEKRYTVKPSLRKKVGLISEVPRINIEMILEIGENKV